jgi:hypothetical protein
VKNTNQTLDSAPDIPPSFNPANTLKLNLSSSKSEGAPPSNREEPTNPTGRERSTLLFFSATICLHFRGDCRCLLMPWRQSCYVHSVKGCPSGWQRNLLRNMRSPNPAAAKIGHGVKDSIFDPSAARSAFSTVQIASHCKYCESLRNVTAVTSGAVALRMRQPSF